MRVREAQRLSLVAVGGVIGALLRYGVSQVLEPQREISAGLQWPWATLVVNLVGALAIGILAGLLVRSSSEYLVPLLITGVVGGFTTVSALALETFLLADSGAPVVALGYFAITMSAGFFAVMLGHRIAGDRT